MNPAMISTVSRPSGLLSHLVNGAALAQLTTAMWPLRGGWGWSLGIQDPRG